MAICGRSHTFGVTAVGRTRCGLRDYCPGIIDGVVSKHTSALVTTETFTVGICTSLSGSDARCFPFTEDTLFKANVCLWHFWWLSLLYSQQLSCSSSGQSNRHPTWTKFRCR